MNKKFFTLPEEKRQAIINAGYRVFSQNSYKKSPMSEIAGAAGISKSLLFHYFQNKKELYLFLWNNCADVTMQYLNEWGCYEQNDMFENMYRGLKAKACIMRQYPDMGNFVIKAYYEKDPEVAGAIQKSYREALNGKTKTTLLCQSSEEFREGLNLEMMYKDMYWASEGYLWETIQQNSLDAEKLEKDFMKMIDFWKEIYLRPSDEKESRN